MERIQFISWCQERHEIIKKKKRKQRIDEEKEGNQKKKKKKKEHEKKRTKTGNRFFKTKNLRINI